MSQISVNDLSFTYDGSFEPVFEHVTFNIDTDWRLGFIGRNGRGKTTFLKLLMGEYQYSGKIVSSVKFDYFPPDVPDMSRTAAEVAAGVAPEAPEWRLLREMALLEIPERLLSQPFGTLSNGERTKLLICALFLREHNFLLIDEPTNHLDMHGRDVMKKYLAGKSGFILVSHDRAFLDACIDHVLSIGRANITVQQGNFTSWYENKRRQDGYELSENDRLKKDIKRLKNAANEARRWADNVESTKIGKKHTAEKSIDSRAYIGEKSRRMQQRRKNLEKRSVDEAEKKSGLLKNVERAEPLKLTCAESRGKLIGARGISVSYGGVPVFSDISFTLETGQRLALCGRNGCGKSSVLKLIAGEELEHSGELYIKSGLTFSCLPQDTGFLCGDLDRFSEERGIDKSRFMTILRKLDFSRPQLERRLEDMSGGQKKKVLIAACLCETADVYLWDEPLNFVDIESRIQIEELLLGSEPTMIFVEHDRAFVEHVATDILEF